MNLSIAQPLSVGVYSKGEYMDIVLTEEVAEELIINKLNDSAPPAIKFLQAVRVPDAFPDGKDTTGCFNNRGSTLYNKDKMMM